MEDYFAERQKMVEEQLVRRGIKNNDVLDAMRKVQRHLFINNENLKKAYQDSPLPINCSQTISQPYIVALMTEAIDPKNQMRVLEIGTGSGYQTAILAELCCEVFSIERHQQLAREAKKLLKSLNYDNVKIKTEDGSIGWEEEAPFDAIVVTAAAPKVPEKLVKQLKNRCKMVIPVGTQFQQSLELISKRGDSYINKVICDCVFVPLIGKGGWKESQTDN